MNIFIIFFLKLAHLFLRIMGTKRLQTDKWTDQQTDHHSDLLLCPRLSFETVMVQKHLLMKYEMRHIQELVFGNVDFPNFFLAGL